MLESNMSRTRFASLVLLLLAGFAAHAGDGFALDTLQESPPGDRFFSVTDATVVGNMTPSVALQSGWAHDPLVLRSNGSIVANGHLVENQFGLRLGAAVPLRDVVLLDASVSVVGWQRGQTPFAELPSIDSAALGDFRIGARVPTARRVGAAGGRLFLDGALQVGPELGGRGQFNDAAGSSLEALLGARYRRGTFTFGAALGGRLFHDAAGAAPLRVIAQIGWRPAIG
jgi:hypothetical protein